MDSSNHDIPYYNQERYADPTPHKALNKVQNEMDANDARVQQFIRSIKTLVDQSGYDLLARIELHDRRTGKNYR